MTSHTESTNMYFLTESENDKLRRELFLMCDDKGRDEKENMNDECVTCTQLQVDIMLQNTWLCRTNTTLCLHEPYHAGGTQQRSFFCCVL